MKSFLRVLAAICLVILLQNEGISQQNYHKINPVISQLFLVSFDVFIGETLTSIEAKLEEKKTPYKTINTEYSTTKVIFSNLNEYDQEITFVFQDEKLVNIHSSKFFELPTPFRNFLSEINSISFDPRGTLCECSYSIGNMIVGFDNLNIYNDSNYLLIASPQFVSGGAWEIHLITTTIAATDEDYSDIFLKARCGIFNATGKKRTQLIECYNKLKYSCG